MASLNELRNNFKRLQGKEIDLAALAINEAGEMAADLNATQLAEGIKADGSKADFTYAPVTIAQKRQRSGLASVTSHLTNFDSGESYSRLYEKVEGKKVIFGTKTDKEEAISDRMDGKAFGLTNDSKGSLMKENVKPAFLKKIKEFVKL